MRWPGIGVFSSVLMASRALLQRSSEANGPICCVVGGGGLPKVTHCNEIRRTHSMAKSYAREATHHNDAGIDSDQRADQLAFASLCMYFAYSLLPNDAANLCNCSRLMNPLLKAISSGHAIRNPCRFSRVATKS